MNIFLKTTNYKNWFKNLKDTTLKDRIEARIERAENGNLGDVESVGDGVYEMRSKSLGYRLYYYQESETMYRLLLGGHKGNKNEQTHDIRLAKTIKNKLQEKTQ